MPRRRLRTCALAAGVVVLAAAAGTGTFVGTRSARGTDAAPSRSLPAPPGVLAGATDAPATGPATSTPPAAIPDAVAARLGPALRATGLGARVRARVLDVATGRVLLDRGGSAAVAPASTAKLVTAAGVLTTYGPSDRITTRALVDGTGTLTVVGAGDPTLSAAASGDSTRYPGASRLSDLAKQVRAAKVQVRRIVVDGSAFTGPAVSPDWAPEDVPSSYGSAITALMADAGRATPDAAERSATPDLDAGRSLARLLGRPDLPVRRGSVATTGTSVVATVRSAPYPVLVEQMLTGSDNVIAECLARRVAIARKQAASFAGGARAVRAAVRRLGIDPGAGLRDGSGLAPADRVAPAVLAAILRRAAAPVADGNDAARLRSVIIGLPVAAWSGTLASRYLSAASRPAAGVVRAKTGTLTGVSALAGIVPGRNGRLFAFAVIADRTTSTPAAQAALDALATGLAGCGCSK